MKNVYLDRPNVDQFAPHRIVQHQIPELFLGVIQTAHTPIKEAGFTGSGCYLVVDPQGYDRVIMMYLSADGRIILELQAIRNEAPILSAVTAMADGSLAMTTNSRWEQFSTDNLRITQFVGAGLEDLMGRHRKKFDIDDAAEMHSPEQVEQVVENLQQELIQTLRGHGVLGEADATESVFSEAVDRATVLSSINAPVNENTLSISTDGLAADEGLGQSELEGENSQLTDRQRSIMMQIELSQNKTSSTRSSLILLGVSILLFIGIGAFAWNLRFVYFLIPILLFHEAGHFLAMRLFHYRNVKMFFIPLLGAAVSGQNFNVAGWKKVIVSLAGPLPGLIVAIPMAFASNHLQSPLLREATILTVILNLFNLIPLVPLDGGWVMHAILFCRNPWLDAIFRIFAAIMLIIGAVLSGSVLLGAFGALMAFAIPQVFANARIAQSLRDKHVSMDSKDQQTIPLSTAKMIIDELPVTGPQGHTSLAANTTLSIFETLNTRAPGVAASIGLFLLYCLSWVAGLVAIAVLTRGNLFRGEQPVIESPEPDIVFSINVDEIRREYDSPVVSRKDVIQSQAVFESKKIATTIYEQIHRSGLSIALLDRMILVAYSENDADDFQNELELLRNVAIAFETESDKTIDDHWFTVSFDAPDVAMANRIEDESLAYFAFSHLYLIEPWSPIRDLSEQELVARLTYVEIQKATIESHDDPRLANALAALRELGSQDMEVDDQIKNTGKLKQQIDDVQHEFIEALKSKPGMSPAFIDAYLQYLQRGGVEDETDTAVQTRFEANRKALSRFAKLLGRYAIDTKTKMPSIEDMRYHAERGFVVVQGRDVEIKRLAFRSSIDGLLSLLFWLQKQGGSDFRISISESKNDD